MSIRYEINEVDLCPYSERPGVGYEVYSTFDNKFWYTNEFGVDI